MLFVIFCADKPGHGQVRADNRPAHVEHLKAKGAGIKLAGPTVTEDGSAMTGSVIIADFASQKEAEAWAASDPYAKAGLFQSAIVKPFRQVLPPPA